MALQCEHKYFVSFTKQSKDAMLLRRLTCLFKALKGSVGNERIFSSPFYFYLARQSAGYLLKARSEKFHTNL